MGYRYPYMHHMIMDVFFGNNVLFCYFVRSEIYYPYVVKAKQQFRKWNAMHTLVQAESSQTTYKKEFYKKMA